MSEYGIGRRLRALIRLLRQQPQTSAEIVAALPDLYDGSVDSARRMARRDVGLLGEIGFQIENVRRKYSLISYEFPGDQQRKDQTMKAADVLAELAGHADGDDVWRHESGQIVAGHLSASEQESENEYTWIGNVADVRAEYEALIEG